MIDREALAEKLRTASTYGYMPARMRDLIDETVAYLTSAGKRVVPDGWWQTIPKDPSEAMQLAFERTRMGPDQFCRAYRAMLAAAPHPPRQDGAREITGYLDRDGKPVDLPADKISPEMAAYFGLTPVAQKDGAREGEVTRRLGDLLAVIHRDGGHYLAEYGLEKACFDAVEKVIGWLSLEDTTPPAADEAVEAEREACALLVEGACTAVNGKHLRGFTNPEPIARMLAERDFELAGQIRARQIRARSRRDGGGGV